jgi:hypothetical protein
LCVWYWDFEHESEPALGTRFETGDGARLVEGRLLVNQMVDPEPHKEQEKLK